MPWGVSIVLATPNDRGPAKLGIRPTLSPLPPHERIPMTHRTDSAQYRSYFRSRREFLVRSAAALAGGGVIAQWNPNMLWAAPIALTARETATGFLATLSAEQRAQTQLDYAAKERVQWHFIPMETRKGLPLREMTEAQRQAAMGLMAAVTSEAGFRRAVDVMAYEAILLELEGPAQAKRRDYQKFYFTIYGNPEPKGAWGVSIEGHHPSLNMTFDGDRVVDSTPHFFGVNPAKLKRDFQTPDPMQAGSKTKYVAGNRLLLPEEGAAYALLSTLTEEQKGKILFAPEAPADIQWPGEPQPKSEPNVGIAASSLNADQKAKLKAIIAAYSTTLPESVAKDRWNLIEKDGMDKIHFGWAGGMQPTEQHFFRIQGPSFIAELCNYQTDPEGTAANHIHSVWRDLTGDFNLPLGA